MTGTLKYLLESLKALIIPDTCVVCGRPLLTSEKVLCTGCNMKLPRIRYNTHALLEAEQKCFVSGCCRGFNSLFTYRKESPYSAIIKSLKYFSRPDIGIYLGRMLADETLPSGFFSGIDYLVPIPVSLSRRLKRGYNQTEKICEGISAITDIPVSKKLVTKKSHKSQTSKNFETRQQNMENVFTLKDPQLFENKHIAIVDDLVTTGSTLRHAAQLFRDNAPGIKISFITLGITSL